MSDKPSIAVLPFDNISGDPEQEYFSDGITEDLITALSQIRQFLVIARNTTFIYKGQAIDVQAVAKELGVRYILEGSVRKAGNRVRISAQLIDGETGNHLWAQRYDRDLEDVFTVQDEITVTVVGAMQPELEKHEQECARLKKPDDLDAWDHSLKGNWHLYRSTKDELEQAKIYYNRAIATDPNFGQAYVGLAETFVHQWGVESVDRATMANTVLLAEKAVQLDNKDARARQILGWAYLYIAKDTPAAIRELETALELNPSLAPAYAYLAFAQNSAGNAENAIENAYEAIRLSPFDPLKGMFMTSLAQAHLCLHQYEEAVTLGIDAIRQFPQSTRWIRVSNLTSALGHLGRLDEAAEFRNKMIELRPEISLKFIRDNHSLRYPAYQDHFIEGLRKAGVPEG